MVRAKKLDNSIPPKPPGHNAEKGKQGFQKTNPVKPVTPTSSQLFQPTNRQDRLQNNNENNSPPPPPGWDHIQKYGVSCNPVAYFGDENTKRTVHNCICGKKWTRSENGWAEVDSSFIPRYEHIQKYGVSCHPLEVFGKDSDSEKHHACICGRVWVAQRIDSDTVEWLDSELGVTNTQDSNIAFPASATNEDISELTDVLDALTPGVKVKGIRVGCDKCGLRSEKVFYSIEEARKETVESGWTAGKGRNLCPVCAKKDPTKTHAQQYGRVCKPPQPRFGKRRIGMGYICPCGKSYVLSDISEDFGKIVMWEEIKTETAITHAKKYGKVCKPASARFWERAGKTYICPCGKSYILQDISEDFGRIVHWEEIKE